MLIFYYNRDLQRSLLLNKNKKKKMKKSLYLKKKVRMKGWRRRENKRMVRNQNK
jgi:hypothetical protein